ncbi:MAG: RNA chaperone Hfq [Acidobacteriota bacterium]|nr:RNA chaperone Hfq [Acidobacteriota bacterium]
MSSKGTSEKKAPAQTFEEVKYLKHLIETQTPVFLKLSDNEEIHGFVEYFDSRFLRITRKGQANLFVFKHDIKYLVEEPDAVSGNS